MAAEILGFQLEMLDDPALAESAFAAVGEGVPAAAAWRAALDAQIAVFAADEDAYFQARAADLEDLRDRVHLALAGGDQALPPLPAGAILLAEDLSPSRFLAVDWQALGGAALIRGSASSHVAMLARARGVPLLVGLGNAVEADGDAVLDALDGELVVAPSPSTTAAYGARLEAAAEEAAAAAQRVSLPAATAAGTPIAVMINVDDPEAVPNDLLRASDGVGLLRTEFLFIGRPDLPGEATQYTAYRRLIERLGGRPLILRTLDIGGDKPLPALDLPHETNPFLGLRGLRLCLAWPELFRPQLRAAIRASAHGPLSIMLPMVSRAAEVETARAWLEEEARELGLPAPPLGIMVETPAAALALDTMPVAFASIGSNDLTQYVMAAARDGLGAVADLVDPLDPAVLRLIGLVVETAAAKGLPLSLCGDMASDRAGLEALLARGLTRVSVAPAALARVKFWISCYAG
jgi:phosphotransferase system enzyme I (PtsI)